MATQNEIAALKAIADQAYEVLQQARRRHDTAVAAWRDAKLVAAEERAREAGYIAGETLVRGSTSWRQIDYADYLYLGCSAKFAGYANLARITKSGRPALRIEQVPFRLLQETFSICGTYKGEA